MKNIVIGITGASGAVYGVRLIECLKSLPKPPLIHLVVSDYGKQTILIETNKDMIQISELVDYVYENDDISACIASGSYSVNTTIIIPCSMKTLSTVAWGMADNLIARVCDVALKENRPLIMCPRETPFNAIHLENMLRLSQLGVHIIPPMPAFYNNPQTIQDIVDHHVMKVLDHMGVSHDFGKRWRGERVVVESSNNKT